ncbi:MAG: hypothetical protein U0270_37270 [Labilithrix sp.]
MRARWVLGIVAALGCSSSDEHKPANDKVYRPNLTDVAIGKYEGERDVFAVAVSDDGRFQWTFDFASWSAGADRPGGPALRTISAATGFFLLGGDDYRLSLCQNSLTNCVFSQAGAPPGAFRKSAVCGGFYYLVGEHGTIASFSGPGAVRVPSGVTSTDVLSGVACDGSRVVVVTENDAAYSGPLGGDLERVTGTGQACGVAFGAGVFVEARADGTIETSPDGKTWTKGATPPWTTPAESCDVAFGNGTFVVSNTTGDLFSSGDGKSWSRIDYGAAARLNGVGMNETGKLLAVGANAVAIEGSCAAGACPGPRKHEILVEAMGSGDAGK